MTTLRAFGHLWWLNERYLVIHQCRHRQKPRPRAVGGISPRRPCDDEGCVLDSRKNCLARRFSRHCPRWLLTESRSH